MHKQGRRPKDFFGQLGSIKELFQRNGEDCCRSGSAAVADGKVSASNQSCLPVRNPLLHRLLVPRSDSVGEHLLCLQAPNALAERVDELDCAIARHKYHPWLRTELPGP